MKRLSPINILILLISIFILSSCGHHKRYGKHFDNLDLDKDQKISQEEWLSKFKIIDTNSDGFITNEEMKNKHKSYGYKSCEHKTCDHKSCEHKESDKK